MDPLDSLSLRRGARTPASSVHTHVNAFSKNVYPGSVYATPSQRHACVLWMPSTKIDSSSKGGCMKLSAIICAGTLAVSLHAEGPTGFVDTFVVKVKPEKRADFDRSESTR